MPPDESVDADVRANGSQEKADHLARPPDELPLGLRLGAALALLRLSRGQAAAHEEPPGHGYLTIQQHLHHTEEYIHVHRCAYQGSTEELGGVKACATGPPQLHAVDMVSIFAL